MALFMSPTGSDRAAGKRERRKRATLLELRVAAIDLSARRGFSNVTVEDIAGAAGVSVRTFFNYFESKEAALVGGDPGFIESLRAGLTVLPRTMPPLAALRLVILARARDMTDELAASPAQEAALLRRMAVVQADPGLLAAHTRQLAAVERELRETLVTWLGGDARVEPYAALLAASVMGAMRIAGMCWSARGGELPADEVTGAALDALAGGLSYELPDRAGNAAVQLFGTRPAAR
jgi:AcrR family transcriptional regulator